MSKYEHLAAMLPAGQWGVSLITDGAGRRWATNLHGLVALDADAFTSYGWVPDGVYRLGKNRPPDPALKGVLIGADKIDGLLAKEHAGKPSRVTDTGWEVEDAGWRLRLLRREDDTPVWVNARLWEVWRAALPGLTLRVRPVEAAPVRFELDGQVMGLLMPIHTASVKMPAVPAWLAESRKAA